MEYLIKNYILPNWQRKLVAILVAVVIWFIVDNSIIAQKTIPNVPIRIVNLPSDKTIQGILPNGILSKRISLTLNGSKDVIEQLEPGDIEVVLDASSHPNEWLAQITKKNLVSLNPNIDLANNISMISHPELFIQTSRLITAKIPVTIEEPVGTPPAGYEYLDIWPKHFMHTVTGPEEQVNALENKGLELTFNLSDITKNELDQLKHSQQQDDEISFMVPEKWKQVTLPLYNGVTEVLNDSTAQQIHIDFLRLQIHPLKGNIPIRVFFPWQHRDTLNPNMISLEKSDQITVSNGIATLALPLFVRNISQRFLEIIQNRIEITILTRPEAESPVLDWGVDLINPQELEEDYVNSMLIKAGILEPTQQQKNQFKERFCDYVQDLTLYTGNGKELKLRCFIRDNKIFVQHIPE